MTSEKYDHWLPSKWGHDEAIEAMNDVTTAVAEQSQADYVAERKGEADRLFQEIADAFERSVSRSRMNYLNEQRERLKQCLYDRDFYHVADQIKQEAESLYMVPFSKL